MEEPLGLMGEPQDEAERRALDPGGFTGIYVQDARQTLDSMLEEPIGVLVERLVENSPGASAGLEPGDLLLEVDAPTPEGGTRRVELHWPSQWREVELASREGDQLALLYDRAGAERDARLTVERRLAPAERSEVERVREERRTGVVLRTATEVEARAAGLGPGAGAVVVGLSHDSPWRTVGVQFEDLIAKVDGEAVDHPSELVGSILAADEDDSLALELWRKGERLELDAPLARRERELKSVHVPLIFRYERQRESSETSFLFGLFGLKRTSAAWQVRLLWFITFGGGDADRLVEVEG
jgi:S1-C subfamily serine protease